MQRQLTAKDYVAMFKRRWWMFGLLAILGGAVGFATARVLPKRYTSQTLVLVQQPTVPMDIVKSVVSEDINQRLAGMQQQILSRSRLEEVIRQFGLFPSEVGQVSMDDLVDRFRKMISVTPMQPMAETRAQNLPGFTVAVTFNDPRAAQQLCSTITTMFMDENMAGHTTRDEQTTEFLGKHLDDAKAALDDKDANLAAFKRRYQGSLPDEEQTNLNLLTGANAQLEAATQALSRAQQDKSFAESMLTQQLSAWQASQAGQNPETLEQQLSALQTQLIALQAKYTDDHPDVIKLKSDIANLNKKIAEADAQRKTSGTEKSSHPLAEPATIQQLRAQIHQYDQVIKERSAQQEDIQKQIKIYQARVQSSPAVEQEYKQLTRDYQTALDFYNGLLKERDQTAMAADLDRRQQGEQFRILDPANLPEKPSFPQLKLFAAGGAAGGLGLAFGLALLFEMQDTSLHSEREVEVALHLPVLAMLPVITGEPSKSGYQLSLAKSRTRS
jgi:polysaccharide chain length determinant protein (PEP-CTERM system associated)